MMNILLVGLCSALVLEFGIMYKLLEKEYYNKNRKSQKIKCIDDTDFDCHIIIGREYIVLDEKVCGNNLYYKLLDEFYDELWIDSNKFEKVDD